MQTNLLFAITSLIVMMSVVDASPMPTAAPMIRRQDSGAQTTAPYTSTYDPSQGFSGNGCNLGSGSGVAVCCPAGYQNQSINGNTSCVKVGSGGGNSGGSDNGDDDDDDDDDDGNGNSDTDTGVQSGATTYTSDGAIVVSHGISQNNDFSTHMGVSTSESSSGSSSGSGNRSGSNDASITRIPVSLVLAVIGAVVIGAF